MEIEAPPFTAGTQGKEGREVKSFTRTIKNKNGGCS
jgi:hypothetical protein